MKKLIFSLSFLCLLAQTTIAQDVSGFYKKAKKSFEKYQQSDDKDKLEDALSNIKNAIQLIDKADDKKAVKIWMKAGEIYNEIALEDYKIFLVNTNHQPTHPKASVKAYEAFWNTIEKADKKWDKSDAMDELLKTATFISNEGVVAYNQEAYEKAYESFKLIIDIRDFLSSNEHISILNKKGEYNQHLLKTALAADKADKPDAAIEYYEKLKDAQFDNSAVYLGLYNIYNSKGEEAKALTVLKDGRTLFPDDEGLMVQEINYYLKNGKMSDLTTKLESAIEMNPNNVSLYATLGHVYNELQKSEAEKGNFTQAKHHFEQSMSYFTRALDIDGTYAPALYNIGALYYNNAAILTKEIKSIEHDKTARGIRNANAKRSQMLGLLDKSLPYFQRAEALNPSDQATLNALKEIYSRKNDTSMLSEFTNRLEKVESGLTIEQGYFDN